MNPTAAGNRQRLPSGAVFIGPFRDSWEFGYLMTGSDLIEGDPADRQLRLIPDPRAPLSRKASNCGSLTRTAATVCATFAVRHNRVGNHQGLPQMW